MRVLVHAPLATSTGYGRDGVGLIIALLKAGHMVDVAPSAVIPPIPAEVADTLTFPIEGVYDVEIHHVPPMGAAARSLAPEPPRKRVLWTMWEWDTFPDSVTNADRARKAIPTYDEVVCYTEQTKDAFLEAGLFGEDQKVSVQQGGFDPETWFLPTDLKAEPYSPPFRSAARDTFRMAMVGVLSSRKNPYTVIQAFMDLKAEHGDNFDASLILKTDFPMLPNSFDVPDIHIVKGAGWSDEQLRAFYWTLDCLINVSWGEGKDLPALEATMCGVPTILNDTPGHRGWVHPGIQELVPATKIPMDPEYTGRFTGVEEVKAAMMEAYNNRIQNFRRAKQLADYVEQRVSWDYRIKKFGEKIGVPL